MTAELRIQPATWGYERALSLGLDVAEAGAFSRRIVGAYMHGQRACMEGKTNPAALARKGSTCPDSRLAFREGHAVMRDLLKAIRDAGRRFVMNGGTAPSPEADLRYPVATYGEAKASVFKATFIRGANRPHAPPQPRHAPQARSA